MNSGTHMYIVVKCRHRENGLLHGKAGNSNENSNGTLHPVEMFRKKVIPSFRGVTFFPLLPKRPKFSVPFVWISSARLPP